MRPKYGKKEAQSKEVEKKRGPHIMSPFANRQSNNQAKHATTCKNCYFKRFTHIIHIIL